jgi:hypothetical protein
MKRKIASRYWMGDKRYAILDCGHVIHCPKSIDWKEGTGVECKECE